MYELPEKVIKKSNEELIDIHKKCISKSNSIFNAEL